jgi:hypothetical protein
MWKLSDTIIKETYEVTNEFVEDVFGWAINNRKASKDKLMDSIKNQKLLSVSLKCNTLCDIMIKLSQCDDINSIYDNYKYYTSNFDLILNANKPEVKLNPSSLKVSSEAFKYFYKELIDTDIFWEIYGGGKKTTKNRFRKSFGIRFSICPYCNAHTISYVQASNIDHFLPISRFPVLGVYWGNFVMCCSTCNLYIKNDSEIKLPILHPYKEEIANYITFTFNRSNNLIGVSYNATSEVTSGQIENYLNLFKIKEVYGTFWSKVEDERVDVFRSLKKAVEMVENVKIDDIRNCIDEDLEDYINNLKRKRYTQELIKLKIDYVSSLRLERDNIAKFFYIELGGKNALFKTEQAVAVGE